MGTRGRLLQGDCFDVLPTINSESVDLVCFSPPYDTNRQYHGFTLMNRENRIALGRELHRVAKPGSICAILVGDQTINGAKSTTSFRWVTDWVDETGWRLWETCIYHRHGAPFGWDKRFRVDHEYLHLFVKGKSPAYFDRSDLRVPCKHAGVFSAGAVRQPDGSIDKKAKVAIAADKCCGTVWRYTKSCSEGNRTKTLHPATNSDGLFAALVKCFCREGGVVLDPFCGSGTTCVVAANLSRRYIGIELSAEYAKIARTRIDTEVFTDIFAYCGDLS